MLNAPSKEWICIIIAPVNPVSSNMNALQVLSLNDPVQDLMLNHFMLATPDPETQREWELNTASRAGTPTTAELVTFLRFKMKTFRATSDNPITEGCSYHFTLFTHNWNQGQ